jgi:hypothetical protein
VHQQHNSRTRRFWPLHLKSKIEEIEDWRSRRLKHLKIEKVEQLKKSKI